MFQGNERGGPDRGEPGKGGPKRKGYDRGGPPPYGGGPHPEFEAIMKKEVERILAILTPDQMKKWQELTGGPFTGSLRGPGEHRPKGPPPDFGPN